MSENVHLEFSPMAFRKTSVPERIQLETIKDEEEDN